LKSGESAELRNYYFLHKYQSIMVGTPVLDVLEDPEELDVKLKPGIKHPPKCTKQVLGRQRDRDRKRGQTTEGSQADN